MKLFKSVVTLMMATLLITGCSMSRDEIRLEEQKLKILAAVAAQPTLTCITGCTYIDPKRNLALFPKETNGWDFANKVLETGIAVAPWMAITNVAAKGIANAGNNVSNVNSGNSHSEQNTALNAGGDLLDNGSSKDESVTTNTSNVEDVRGVKVVGDYDAHTEANSANRDDSIKDSNNGGNDNSSVTPTVISPTVITPTVITPIVTPIVATPSDTPTSSE